MIAAVKRWHAVSAALLFCLQPAARAADDLAGATRELARKTAAFAGRGEPVSVAWRNVSSSGAAAYSQARSAFELALRDLGNRVTEVAPVAEIHLTLSENQTQYLIVEEARKGDDRQVWIASWKRADTAPPANGAPSATVDKRLVFEQPEPILDALLRESSLLVLSPSRVALYGRENGQWELKQSAPLPQKTWPRDLRGRLRANGPGFQVYLPGTACSGNLEPGLTLECTASDQPWVLESGSHALLVAEWAPGRNYFEGHVTVQTGARKTVAPFFSAAAVEDQGRQLWLLAMLDGHTQIVDAAFEPVGGVGPWGSDMAGTEARCGGGSQVLVTKAGDAREGDAIRAYTVVNHVPAPLTAPVDFPGPVTALWTAGPTSALAVARDTETGRYGAWLITVNCGS